MRFYFTNILHPSVLFMIFYGIFFISYPFLIKPFLDFDFFEISREVYIMVIIYPIVFLLSVLFINTIIFRKRVVYIGKLYNDLPRWRLVYRAFYSFSIICFLYFYYRAGEIPILAMDVENSRVELKKGLGKYVILGTSFAYISLSFKIALESFKSHTKKIRFVLELLFSIILIIGVGYRSPAAYLLVTLFLLKLAVSSTYRKNRKIKAYFFIVGFLFLLSLSALGYYRHQGSFTILAFLSIFWTFAVNVKNLEDIVQFFPYHHDFMYGRSFLNDILAVFHIDNQVFTGIYLKDIMGLTFPGEGMTVTCIGEGYINFGYFGIIGHAIFLAITSTLIFKIIVRTSKISSYVILVFIVIAVARMSIAGIMPIVFFTLLPNLILSILFVLLSRIKY